MQFIKKTSSRTNIISLFLKLFLALIVILGVIFGTYSSIYIANTVLVRLRVSQKTVLREDDQK